MIFVASPYSVEHGTPEEKKEIREARYYSARKHCGNLASREIPCYSPIVHWHEVAKTYSLEKGAAFWKRFNLPHLLSSHKLQILTLPGWESSEGIQWEYNMATKHGIPTQETNPSTAEIQRQTRLLENARPS